MPMRPSHDRPVNDPLSRMGYIRYRSIDGDFERLIISYPGYGLQPGETPEPARLGARARSQWHQEAGLWNIRAPDDPRDRMEVLVDGRPGPLNPPAIGWPMTASGFGIQFADALEPSVPSGLSTNAVRVAFHPSGKAVLVQPMDSNGDLEIWEWIPGTGFGKKYHVVRMWEAEDDVKSLYNGLNGAGTSSFAYPRIDQTGRGQFAFSPDGNYLAIAGEVGTTHEGDAMPLVVVPFNLQNGLDLLHPQYPSGDHSGLGNANCVVWSPDNEHIGIGTTGSPFARFWNWGVTGFSTVEADPASTPDDEVSWLVFNRAGTFLHAGMFGTTAADNPKAWAWTPNVGWGTVVSPPADTLDTLAEVHGMSVSPAGDYVLVIAKNAPGPEVMVYEFDTSGGGSWGNQIAIDDWDADAMSLQGGALSPDGKLIVAIGDGGGPVARLYTLSGGVGTFVEEINWSGTSPQVAASVAWRP